MKIKYFADIRDLTRENETQWSGRDRTLDELLRALAARYGEPFRRRIFQGEGLSDSIIVLVNGRDIRHLGGAAATIEPDDTISIFPVVAGGDHSILPGSVTTKTQRHEDTKRLR